MLSLLLYLKGVRSLLLACPSSPHNPNALQWWRAIRSITQVAIREMGGFC